MNQILNLARSKSVNEKQVLDKVFNSLEGDEILGDKNDQHEDPDIPF
jgi:hypothetical protein